MSDYHGGLAAKQACNDCMVEGAIRKSRISSVTFLSVM